MKFSTYHPQFNRLRDEHPTWRLLRADNAPLVLAFIADLFSEETEVSYGRARAVLQSELDRLFAEGHEIQQNAGGYIRQWIQAGWLRESDNLISRTDAAEAALRLAQNLEQREVNASASHLRIVQHAVLELVIALSGNPDNRIGHLEKRKAEIDREIQRLRGGYIDELSAAEQRERIREVYQLAALLTGDFRRVEDEVRQLDQRLRVRMIESDESRGAVLQAVLTDEALLAQTDAGLAFDGFFQLLCDQNRNTEFREQLRGLLRMPAAEHLSERESRYLGNLVRELTSESRRVFQARRRTEESLRAYIESGAHLEHRAVDRLLHQLEQCAVELRDSDCSLDAKLDLSFNSGSAKVRAIDNLRLCLPDEQFDIGNLEAQPNDQYASDATLANLESVRILEVAQQIASTLEHGGPMTIGELIQHHPVAAGLEELVAYLRVAQAVRAPRLENKESIHISDRDGNTLSAAIPVYQLTAELFPTELAELNL